MSNHLQVAGVVTFYMVAALVMVMGNKMVLNDAPDLPLIFMLLQCLSTVGLLTLTSKLTDKVQVPQIEMRTAKQLAPLFLIDVVGFVFNTLCLRDVEATFFQIARGLVLPFTIIVSAIHIGRRPSTLVIVAASVVTVGFFVGVSPFDLGTMPRPMGLVYGLLSSLSIAVHAVVVKGSLPVVGGSVTQLSYWSNFSTAFALGALILVNGEAVTFVSLLRSGTWDWRVFLWGNLVTGLFGFLISIAGILSVKVTSPVTHMFSSTARSVIQTLLGVKLFHDTLSGNRIASLSIITAGTLFYTWIKSRQTGDEWQQKSEPPSDVEAQRLLESDDEELSEKKDAEGAFEKALKSVVREKV